MAKISKNAPVNTDTAAEIITLESHPATLPLRLLRTRDGETETVEEQIPMIEAILPFFNVCNDTSLKTLQARTLALGLAAHGDKGALVARVHRDFAAAQTMFATVAGWQADPDTAPSVEAGKRGRPLGSGTVTRPQLVSVFDGTGPVTCTAYQASVYGSALSSLPPVTRDGVTWPDFKGAVKAALAAPKDAPAAE